MATDAGTPAEPAAGLQFDNVEHATPGGAGACARCTRQITDEYFEIGGNLLCPSCATELRGGEGGAGPFLRALGFGAGAAVVSTIVWYLIVKATNYEIGLIAVAVGLFIGVAVRKGSRGRGGWKYQALAIALTYGAITASKIPFIIDAVRDQAAKKQTAGKQADPAPADAKQADKPAAADADANKPPTAGQVFLAFALLFGLALASPFLGGFDNIIGILIIGFALYEAWKMNRRLPVNGPFRLAAATPALQHVSPANPAPATRPCDGCGAALATSLRACPACGRLVHSDALKSISADAERAERSGDVTVALGAWRSALNLLPPTSVQHQRIAARVEGLSQQVTALPAAGAGVTAAAPSPARPSGWKGWLAGLGAIGLVLAKFKWLLLVLLSKGKLLLVGLTQAKTFLSMALTLGLYATQFGWWFAAGLVVSIYIHEMGHVAALRRYGIPATAPMFIPGLGAFVRLKQHPATAGEDARVGLAGPIWGAAAAIAALVIGLTWHAPTWLAIARVGAWINIFNLIPVWQLDGGRGFAALTRRQRTIAAVVLWLLAVGVGEGMLFLVAIGATYRAAVPGNAPATGDRNVLATYLALCVGLTALMAGVGK